MIVPWIALTILGSMITFSVLQNYENKKSLEQLQAQKILSVHITDGEKHLIVPPIPNLINDEPYDLFWEDLPNLCIEYAHDTKTLYIRLCLDNEASNDNLCSH